ncbi:hypothetical protein BDV25DRAFT_150650 [Aspergillus avenaceus]|uniref:Aminoglycoside phosphotransferase domain-containing protein n=1 Tax=Aspergillus avenaceus TaxID=36643 RepID=A0A5N6U2R5_ASPAV|nr:hypothetical protein BDV25DRAFT_150650 [Aspergillus avenaceus]
MPEMILQNATAAFGRDITLMSGGFNVMSLSFLVASDSCSGMSGKLANIIRQIFTSAVQITSVTPLEAHLHPICLIMLSNGVQLLLKCSPAPLTPLLRREQSMLETEGRALTLLEQSGLWGIPKIFHHSSQRTSHQSGFLLRQYINGVTLEEAEPGLTAQERKDIDRSLGSLARQVGQHVSQAFGTLEQVANGSGRRSWRDAFTTLFESILRDSEDVFVNLPYTELRHQVCRLSPALDEVRLPQLVVIDFGRPSQVLLDPVSKTLSGIVDFGKALWGDIYMAEVFEHPSSSILDGFGISCMQTKAGEMRQLLYVIFGRPRWIPVDHN